jgi:serine/threonine protein kinase
MKQILLALSHCHSRRIVHRDIKPGNILCTVDDNVQVCDFGLAARLPAEGWLKGCHGSAPYMSPEMVKHEGHDCSTDMWSLGAVLYVFTFDSFPYMPAKATSQDMKAEIANGATPPKYASDTEVYKPSADTVPFMQRLMDRYTFSRMSADDALNHAFITSSKEVQSKEVQSQKGEFKFSLRRPLYPRQAASQVAPCSDFKTPSREHNHCVAIAPEAAKKLDERSGAEWDDNLSKISTSGGSGVEANLHSCEFDQALQR